MHLHPPPTLLQSASNPFFRRCLRLAGSARMVRRQAQALAEGIHLAQAALDAQHPIEAALLRRGAAQPQLTQILQRLPSSVARFELAPALYDQLAPVEQGAGLILVLTVPQLPPPRGARVDLVYLDGVQDPGNVGAVLRTAAAAGVGHVLAGPGTAALWSPKVLRAGMGAHLHLGLYEQIGPEVLATTLDGPWIGAAAHQGAALWDVGLPQGPVGWMFGAEGAGLSAAALALCAMRVRVPTAAAVESLNIAAAAAVCLFERRRRLARPVMAHAGTL